MATGSPAAPYGSDYRDPRTSQQKEDEHAGAQMQRDHLRQLGSDPDYLRAAVQRLQRHRAGTALPQIELVPGVGPNPVLVAAQRFLARRPTEDVAADAVHQAGFQIVDLDPRRPFVLLVPNRSQIDADVTSPELLRRLTQAGVAATYDHIVPLGPVIKAAGGPEPTAATQPFPAVTYPTTGPAPRVAVIDTGVSLEQRADGYLAGLAEPDNIDALDALPFPQPDGLLDAGAGHGAFVSGVVQQVAPTAVLRVYRATWSDGLATDDNVHDAIVRAADEGAQIVNLSLGTSTADGNPPPGIAGGIRQALATNPDILFVAAAGNDGSTGTPVYPAALAASNHQVIAVAGLDPTLQPSLWSSRGAWVTCSTIGEGVMSTYVIGTEDGVLIDDPQPDTYGPNAWATWTGTSFAAPQITGAVARRCHEQGIKPRAAFDSLVAGMTPLPDWGYRLQLLPGTP